MKQNISLIFLITFSFCYSQKAEFNKLSIKSNYDEYYTKNGDILKLGDTLIIGIPISELGFTYISQGGQRVSNTLSEKKILIDKLKTYGSKSNGYKMYAHFKGYGLLPVLIDYETAFELGEIKNPNAKLTKKQAIEKLKEAEELLDLGVLKEEEYLKTKEKLTKIILN
jgi:hypothetical protein